MLSSRQAAIDLYLVPAFGNRRIEQLTPAAVQKWRFGALFSVALAAGLRLGEMTGLSWDDVDIDTGELRVRQQLQRVGKRLVLQALKTDKSRGTLMLPAVCLKELRKHRQKQLKERLKAGGDWCGIT